MAQHEFKQASVGPTQIRQAGQGETAPPTDPMFVTVMPGSPQRNAQEIKSISPEKEPGDPKTGPGAMYAFMGASAMFLVVASLILSVWIGWAGAAMAAAFGVLAFAFNPEIIATFSRADERGRLLKERAKHEGRPPN